MRMKKILDIELIVLQFQKINLDDSECSWLWIFQGWHYGSFILACSWVTHEECHLMTHRSLTASSQPLKYLFPCSPNYCHSCLKSLEFVFSLLLHPLPLYLTLTHCLSHSSSLTLTLTLYLSSLTLSLSHSSYHSHPLILSLTLTHPLLITLTLSLSHSLPLPLTLSLSLSPSHTPSHPLLITLTLPLTLTHPLPELPHPHSPSAWAPSRIRCPPGAAWFCPVEEKDITFVSSCDVQTTDDRYLLLFTIIILSLLHDYSEWMIRWNSLLALLPISGLFNEFPIYRYQLLFPKIDSKCYTFLHNRIGRLILPKKIDLIRYLNWYVISMRGFPYFLGSIAV